MTKAVQKILSKYGLTTKRSCKNKFRVFDNLTEESLIKMRDEAIRAFVELKRSDSSYIEELLARVAKTEVSRYDYKHFAKITGYEVVWGQGGHQKNRCKELEGKGVKYIWIDYLNE